MVKIVVVFHSEYFNWSSVPRACVVGQTKLVCMKLIKILNQLTGCIPSV